MSRTLLLATALLVACGGDKEGPHDTAAGTDGDTDGAVDTDTSSDGDTDGECTDDDALSFDDIGCSQSRDDNEVSITVAAGVRTVATNGVPDHSFEDQIHTVEALDLTIADLRDKLMGLQKDVMKQRKTISDREGAIKSFQSDLHETSRLIQAPKALAASKQLIARVPQLSRDEAFDWTAPLSLSLFRSDEAKEGIGAFRERRDASWVPESRRKGTGRA